MPGFETNFERVQREIKNRKMTLILRRCLSIQARNKIKPTIMNPNLAEMSRLRGGNLAETVAEAEQFYPKA